VIRVFMGEFSIRRYVLSRVVLIEARGFVEGRGLGFRNIVSL